MLTFRDFTLMILAAVSLAAALTVASQASRAERSLAVSSPEAADRVQETVREP